jgi:Tol biopolymer transport system component
LIGFQNGGGGRADKPISDAQPPKGDAISRAPIRVAPLGRGGHLTIVGLPSRNGEGPPGWYGLSTVEAGRLHPFLRCPKRAGWCGDVLSVAWSRDGTGLAFSVTSVGGTAAFNGVHIVDLRARTERWQLTSDPGDPVDLEWSPDGSRLAFASDWSIYVLDTASFRLRPIPSVPGEFDSSPSWSPQGNRLVFAAKRDHRSSINLVDLDGSHRRLLAKGATAPAWSPDGTKIAYRSNCGGIKLITPAGNDVTPARSHSPCTTVGVTGAPVWSHDGKRIAIFAHKGSVLLQRSGTYVMDADGRNLALLTDANGTAGIGGAADAAWEPRVSAPGTNR